MVDLKVCRQRIVPAHARGRIGLDPHHLGLALPGSGGQAARDHHVAQVELAGSRGDFDVAPEHSAPARAVAHRESHLIVPGRELGGEVGYLELGGIARRRRHRPRAARDRMPRRIEHHPLGPQAVAGASRALDLGHQARAAIGLEARDRALDPERPRAGRERGEHAAAAARHHRIGERRDRVGVGKRIRIAIERDRQHVILRQQPVVHLHRHAEARVLPQQDVARRAQHPDPAADHLGVGERNADRVVDGVRRRAVAHVHLAALVPGAAPGVVVEEVGVSHPRPVLELGLVLAGGEIGIDVLPEAPHVLDLEDRGEPAKRHGVALGGHRADVLEPLPHLARQPRQRRGERAVAARHAPEPIRRVGERDQRVGALRVGLEGALGGREGAGEVASLAEERDQHEPGVALPRVEACRR